MNTLAMQNGGFAPAVMLIIGH